MALLTQTSIPPNPSAKASAACATASASATSAAKASARPPACSTSRIVPLSPASPRAISPTFQPCRANSWATARPTPALAPAIITVLRPFRLGIRPPLEGESLRQRPDTVIFPRPADPRLRERLRCFAGSGRPIYARDLTAATAGSRTPALANEQKSEPSWQAIRSSRTSCTGRAGWTRSARRCSASSPARSPSRPSSARPIRR